jgi:hypothetical protein
MVPMVRRNQGPELERARPVIDNFFSNFYIFLSSSYTFLLSLYFAFTQIVTDALPNKHAHVTMGYFEFLWVFEVLFVWIAYFKILLVIS